MLLLNQLLFVLHIHFHKIDNWRKYVISEYDYSTSGISTKLRVSSKDARLFMIFNGRYKLIHAEGGFQPMVFDLQSDPNEFHDLALEINNNQSVKQIVSGLYKHLAEWSRRPSQRTTMSQESITEMRGQSQKRGITLGMYDGSETDPKLYAKYTGKAKKIN